MILAVMYWLSNGQEVINLVVSQKESIQVSKSPKLFLSPVTYKDPDVIEPVLEINEEDEKDSKILDDEIEEDSENE